MKVLYIHGLNSLPTPEKLEILKKSGLEPVAIHLDYRNQPDAYDLLLNEALNQDVKMVIGSSLGGYMGFWIAEELGIPCLLFNPAMNVADKLPLIQPSKKTRNCPLRMVVIGAQDDVLDPEETLNVMRISERKNMVQKVITCHWLGHQIDMQSFREMIHWAIYNVKKLSEVQVA